MEEVVRQAELSQHQRDDFGESDESGNFANEWRNLNTNYFNTYQNQLSDAYKRKTQLNAEGIKKIRNAYNKTNNLSRERFIRELHNNMEKLKERFNVQKFIDELSKEASTVNLRGSGTNSKNN